MGRIQKLKEEVIKRIAAGEVVERPASVVKELLENALDANATEIKIFLENGGKSLIKIIDNGTGILQEDLKIILEPYTTSKIQNLEDIYKINTLGFRGEALHAISSISKITIISKPKNQKIAYQLSNYPKINIKPTSKSTGTTVIVEDLFYNIPARKKFLKSDKTELKHILEIIEAYVISNYHIKFSIYHNDKEILNLPTASNIKQRLSDILKLDSHSIYEIKDTYFNYKIHALLPSQEYQLKNKGFFKIFVNNRYIINNAIKKAAGEALIGFIPKDTKISGVVLLEIPPNIVDVNIHPRKTEIKFENPYRIYAFVKNAIQKFISNISKQHVLTNLKNEKESIYNNLQSPNNKFDKKLELAYQRLRNPKQASKYRYFNDSSNMQLQSTTQPAAANTVLPQQSYSKNSLYLNDSNNLNNNYSDSTNMDINIKTIKNIFQNNTINNVVQIFKKYILLEIGSELWVIDQHAAYERIRFEKLKNNKSINTQMLTTPIKIQLTPSQLPIINEIKKHLNKIGFIVQIKNDIALVKGIPSILPANEIISSFYKAINNVLEPEQALQEFKNIQNNKHEILTATFACHTAIRTGDTLSKQEMLQMVEDLLACEIPTSCPHGRPTIHKLSITDIDKWFLRTY